ASHEGSRNMEEVVSSRMHATRRCRQVRLAVAAPVLAVLPALLLAGCASGGGAPSRELAGTRSNERGSPPPSADPNEVYNRMGLLVNGGDLPFVGRIGYLAGPSPESTTVLLTLSVPAAAISFSREAPQR